MIRNLIAIVDHWRPAAVVRSDLQLKAELGPLVGGLGVWSPYVVKSLVLACFETTTSGSREDGGSYCYRYGVL